MLCLSAVDLREEWDSGCPPKIGRVEMGVSG